MNKTGQRLERLEVGLGGAAATLGGRRASGPAVRAGLALGGHRRPRVAHSGGTLRREVRKHVSREAGA